MTAHSTTSSHETPIAKPMSGIVILILGIAGVLATIGVFIRGVYLLAKLDDPTGGFYLGGAALLLITSIFFFVSLTMVRPNEARLVLLFGDYRGTLRKNGLWAVNPFTTREAISTKVHNFDSDKLKVNDSRGNPIEIATVVVWRVRDTAQAAFDVEDHESYVEVQSEAALRHIASTHPYDFPGEEEDPEVTTLRGSADLVSNELAQELSERLDTAGIEVLEARLSHLAYAPEIASAMLQRQQADAIISARRRIVDGAVGMVRMALTELDEGDLLQLDDERKASMVSNLLVVLCGERSVQPIVNAGTIYGG